MLAIQSTDGNAAMSSVKAPFLDPADDLTQPVDIDLNAALAPLIAQRIQSPIIRPSKATDISALIDESDPVGGDSLQDLVDQITAVTDQYPRRNTHPGFFGWIAPSGLPTDPLAHAIVTVLNENLGGYWASPVGTTVERLVVKWMAELLDFPAGSDGVMLSGGSLANMSGMASALSHRFGPDYRNKGISAFCEDGHPVIVCSREAHFSIRRAAAMLGIGTDHVIAIDTDAQFRMRIDLLEAALANHNNVVCVVATAGTTTTGAIDPLPQIAALCEQHKIWLHVDAAYGGGALMSETLRPRFDGIEKADSVIMDLHKWFFQSLDGSVLIYRDAAPARALFYESSDYLHFEEDPVPEQYKFFHLTPELSRRFRALPIYISFRCYGRPALGRNVLHNVECAEYLARKVEQETDLEMISPPQLSITCFRFNPGSLDDSQVDHGTDSVAAVCRPEECGEQPTSRVGPLPPPNSPDSEPDSGASGKNEGLTCSYGDDPRISCRAYVECTSGAWSEATTSGPYFSCEEYQAAEDDSCPNSKPTDGNACTVSAISTVLYCAYGEERCACKGGLGSQPGGAGR
ncbi:MAG: aminotransferase class V-fold PLP-dependent enzyme, partial [Pseudomonadota bacterium]